SSTRGRRAFSELTFQVTTRIRSPLVADEDRLGAQGDAEGLLHAGGDLARERDELGGRRPAAVDERERVLRGEADAPLAVAAREARALDEPRRRDLHAPVPLRPGRHARVRAEPLG